MESDARRRIAALRRSHDELAADVQVMDGERLRSSSGCSEWDVSRVLGHLGSGAEIGIGYLERAVAGDGPPDPETYPPIWARWNDLSPEERAAGFVEWDDRQIATLEALDDETLATLLVPLPFLPEPVDVATMVTFRLVEHGLHSWDTRVGADPTAVVPTYLTELVVDLIPMTAGFVGRADQWRHGPATVRTETTAPSREWWLRLGDVVRFETEGSGSTASLHLPAESLMRLVAGRLTPGHTPVDVTVDGSIGLDDLRAVFPGY